MSTGWQKCKLGDVVTLKRGYDLPNRDRIAGNVPIVSSSGITGSHNEVKVAGPGVVTGRYGTLGEVFFIEHAFWPLNTTLYVRDFKGNDPRFISYFLRTLGFSSQSSAGAVPGVNRNYLHNIDVIIPSFPTQRKIAAVLSAYDDLIENNTQRIAALEAAAQALYREWFVEMRFPGHESAEWVESELGRIPRGWEATTTGEAFEITGGGTPSTKKPEFWEDGHIDWFSPSDLTAASAMFMDESSRKITELGLQKSSARLFPPYSVMMTSRATLGVVSINTTEACTNQGFITCLPNERVSSYFLYFWIQENLETINNLASGATFKEISKTNFRKIDFIIPEKLVHEQFKAAVEPIGALILNLLRRNNALREARDLLLPRLISGELSVEDVEIAGLEK